MLSKAKLKKKKQKKHLIFAFISRACGILFWDHRWISPNTQYFTCACSCCLWSWSSDRGTGSWHTSHSAMFRRQWISWVVKFASGILCLLSREIHSHWKKNLIPYGFDNSNEWPYMNTYQLPQNCVFSSAMVTKWPVDRWKKKRKSSTLMVSALTIVNAIKWQVKIQFLSMKTKNITGNRKSNLNTCKGLYVKRAKMENVRQQIVVSALSVCLPGVSSQGTLAKVSYLCRFG